MKNVLTVTGNVMLLAALAAFLWCGTVILRAHFAQTQGVAVLTRATATRSIDRPNINKASPDGPLGKISIQRVGISSVILEGTDRDVLALSVGHVRGTALPGSDGNVALAAHRDTFFCGLEHIRIGDDIRLVSIQGERHYRVDTTRVVAPTDVSVLKETGEPTLTLITCYPFHYIGPAPKRFIVQTHLIQH
jgi:LPXTG-site transpeptidase (sortase) family protein